MKDRIRYSEAFKLKVMEVLREAKWKSVQEPAKAYGIDFVSTMFFIIFTMILIIEGGG